MSVASSRTDYSQAPPYNTALRAPPRARAELRGIQGEATTQTWHSGAAAPLLLTLSTRVTMVTCVAHLPGLTPVTSHCHWSGVFADPVFSTSRYGIEADEKNQVTT